MFRSCVTGLFRVVTFGLLVATIRGPVRADLLLHYDFNDAADPTVVPDLSGNGNDAEILGAAYTDAGGGRSGAEDDRAIDLQTPGDGAHLNVLTAAAGAFDTINANDAATIVLWVYGSDAQPHNNSAFWFQSDVEDRVLQAHLPWSNSNVYFDVGGCCDPDQRINGPTAAKNFKGGWNHYAFVKDGTRTAVYQNGRLFLQSSPDVAVVSLEGLLINNVDIGSGADGGNSYSGLIDDFRVYDNALTLAEIRELGGFGESLEIAPTADTLRVGEEGQLQVTLIAASGDELDVSSEAAGTTYSADPADVVSVNADGLVTAVGVGETIVTATNGDLSVSAAYTVLEPLPPPELLLWYGFNNATNPDLVRDESGNGNTAEILGASYTEDGGGRTGANGDRAMDFKGANDGTLINVLTAADGAFATISANDSATITLWAFGGDSHPHNSSAFWFFGEGATGSGRALQAHLPWSNGQIYFDVAGCCGASQRINAATDPALIKGVWTHYAFVKDESRTAIYQNGELFLESTAEIASLAAYPITQVVFGAAFDASNSYNGLLDEIGVWDGALSQDEINAIMTDGPVLPEAASLAGDCNGDGVANVSDLVCLVGTLFTGFNLLDRTTPGFPCATDDGNVALLDLSADGAIDVSDIVALSNVLFGTDTSGELTCQAVEGCPEGFCR